MIGALASVSPVEVAFLAINFGLLLIVALAFNLQWTNAGVPNLACSVSILMGGMTVSAITTRITFFMVQLAGVELLPFVSDHDWVFNNEYNVRTVTDGFLRTRPELCVSLLAFSLAVSMLLGAGLGWALSRFTFRLKATHLMIVLLPLATVLQFLFRALVTVSGGSLGVYVPDLLAFYQGDRVVLLAILTLSVGLLVLALTRALFRSQYGRFRREVGYGGTWAEGEGCDVTPLRRNVFVFGSAVMAVTGTLLSFTYSYVNPANYNVPFWTYWTILAVSIGGIGSYAGTFLGAIFVVLLRHVAFIYRDELSGLIFFPQAFLLNVLLGALIPISMMLRSLVLRREKPQEIHGMKALSAHVIRFGNAHERTGLPPSRCSSPHPPSSSIQ